VLRNQIEPIDNYQIFVRGGGMETLHVKIHLADGRWLNGDLTVPEQVHGLVIFAHGSGSSRLSPRNRQVAATLQQGQLATLLLDLLTADEDVADQRHGRLRFDIDLLAERLENARQWANAQDSLVALPKGYFGASTGAAAAIQAAALSPPDIKAVVSRGGRPDLAGAALSEVNCPVLLLVGGRDRTVISLNREAYEQIPGYKKLKIVEGASHLFEEPGTLEQVADEALQWFRTYLRGD
jgi:putative phosphoribosyl transferase